MCQAHITGVYKAMALSPNMAAQWRQCIRSIHTLVCLMWCAVDLYVLKAEVWRIIWITSLEKVGACPGVETNSKSVVKISVLYLVQTLPKADMTYIARTNLPAKQHPTFNWNLIKIMNDTVNWIAHHLLTWAWNINQFYYDHSLSWHVMYEHIIKSAWKDPLPWHWQVWWVCQGFCTKH